MSRKSAETLRTDFCCPKCHGRQADVREVLIPKSGLLDLLPSKDNRYIEITCMLCGYTEFYNRAIRLGEKGREAAAEGKPQPKPAEGG